MLTFLKWGYPQIIHLIGFSLISQIFWVPPIYGNPHILTFLGSLTKDEILHPPARRPLASTPCPSWTEPTATCRCAASYNGASGNCLDGMKYHMEPLNMDIRESGYFMILLILHTWIRHRLWHLMPWMVMKKSAFFGFSNPIPLTLVRLPIWPPNSSIHPTQDSVGIAIFGGFVISFFGWFIWGLRIFGAGFLASHPCFSHFLLKL